MESACSFNVMICMMVVATMNQMLMWNFMRTGAYMFVMITIQIGSGGGSGITIVIFAKFQMTQ